jgi:Ferroportin1 (FPN1)
VNTMVILSRRLRLEGVPDSTLGIARGASAMSGIVGTLLYPALAARLGLVRTGLCSIWLQVCPLCVKHAW